MNSTLRCVTYSTSFTTESLPELLFAHTSASGAPTQPRTSVGAKQSNTLPTVVSTVLAAAMLVGLSHAEHIEPPTFVQTAQYTTPDRIIAAKENDALRGYEISSLQISAIGEYLRQHIGARNFLCDVAVIIDGVYGSKVIRNIHVVEDVDTGKPIMELTILSGLPLNDEFDQKDQLLFQRIEAAGLAWGLRDVVISQG